jgi:hypothetical protein
MWLGLVAIGFPPSVLPLALLTGAVAVDLAVSRRLPGWLAGPLVAAVTYLAGALLAAVGALPPWNWEPEVVLLTGAGFTLLWAGLDVVARSRSLTAWRTPVEEHGETPALLVTGGAPTR